MQDRMSHMVCPDLFPGQRVLVVGLGRTGIACVRFLHARGVEFAVTDNRISPPGLDELKRNYPDVPVFLGAFDEQLFKGADIIIVSPGVSINEKEISSAISVGKHVIGDIEIFVNCIKQPVVAITGSNGKSTVTTLVGEMARLSRKKVRVGGNIGTPVLDLADDSEGVELFVFELSSFQLETTYSLNAVVSVILNISEDHMDRYATLAEYVEAKSRIYNGDGVIVFNRDDAEVVSLAKNCLENRKYFSFTLGEPEDYTTFGVISHDGEDWLARGENLILPVKEIKLQGKHNISNVLAALAMGTAIDLPVPAMLEAVRQFAGLSHRTQWVKEFNGVNWINDSKATNVGAALAAIEGLSENKLIVILGGQGKGQDFSPLKQPLSQFARQVFVYGQDAKIISNTLGNEVSHLVVENLAEAVLKARHTAEPGDVVLLSPACASFDMFNGYEHRGDVFMQLVEEVTE